MVYKELKRLAYPKLQKERYDIIFTETELVHEVYRKMVKQKELNVLDQKLKEFAELNQRLADVVELRFCGKLSIYGTQALNATEVVCVAKDRAGFTKS